MADTQAFQPSANSATAPVLPDVNAETYPFDFVQYLLDQTANFSMFATPEPTKPGDLLLTSDANDWFSINGGYGLVINNSLHRFDSVVHPPASDELRVSEAVGEAIGSLRGRWLFCTDECEWTPEKLPPPAIYDPWSPQRFAVVDNLFSFTEADRFHGYGVGRTFPIVVDNQPKLLAAAVGNLMKGEGKFRDREGTFVMTGSITPDLGFVGHISLRVFDPEGALRTNREAPALTVIANPDPSSAFFVMRGEKKDRTVRTTFGPPPGGGLVSLVTPSQFRTAQFNLMRRSGGGLRTEMKMGPVVCKMEATVYFNLLAPPGTALSPVPFTTDEVYRFVDQKGREVGTLTAKVIEGISFDLKFPGAPGQKGVRFAGFGPIVSGTGLLSGVQGILTVNSLIGIAPHALTLMHVLHIIDTGNNFLSGGDGGPRPSVAGSAQTSHPISREENRLSEDDPFYPLLRHAEDYTDNYLRWRRGFRKCSEDLCTIFANNFNQHLNVGEFPGLEIDPHSLRSIFEQGVSPFNLETFNRYGGRAAGVFRTYELGTNKELDVSTLYSYWRPETLRVNGRYAKKISGSFSGYFDPLDLPDLSKGQADIIFNSYREDVGLTSWVEIYQHRRQQRTSFAYKLPHPHEILWFVKDVSIDGQRLENNIFMASHEWKGKLDGKIAYFMVAFFYEIDFNSCTAQLSGDRYWRALYFEE
ncbi:MAG TPA: hypothetical protein VJ875_04150 [Pyrinomonadaceae bacterium]|nr:hypothetical protein [Pyrinomonadaceae bacterium]